MFIFNLSLYNYDNSNGMYQMKYLMHYYLLFFFTLVV